MSNIVFTIGYEQATQPGVVSALREAGVEVLAAQPPLARRPLRQPPAAPATSP